MKRTLARLPVCALAVGGVLLLSACQPESAPTKVATSSECEATSSCDASALLEPEPTEEPTSAAPEPVAPAPTRTAPTRPASSGTAATGMLFAAAGGDGDSWKDRQGREYRMGLINAPEYDECYGSTATAKRKSMTANGFRAKVYATDDYGRRVAVITTASGVNLNVYLARHGYANDKYLATFRYENPSLAGKLDVAFAAAKRERAGLWGACAAGATTKVPSGSSSSCHPDYKTCIPIKGNGSGNGEENDLDCGDIGKPVYVRQIGVDPYRLDADSDGVGCE